MTQPSAGPAAGDAPAPPPAPAQRWLPVGRTESRQWTQADLDHWLRRDPDLVSAAMNNGLLVDLGIGPRRRPYGRER
jgi:hypothetical protein